MFAALVLKQHFTFYDFIINKARGKSGPLFSFDVHDDVRMLHDATKERDEVRLAVFLLQLLPLLPIPILLLLLLPVSLLL